MRSCDSAREDIALSNCLEFGAHPKVWLQSMVVDVVLPSLLLLRLFLCAAGTMFLANLFCCNVSCSSALKWYL
jgi:hypothetical protein